MARFNSDGSLDATIGIGGKLTTDFFGREDLGRAVALQRDGRILVAGQTLRNDDAFGLARYDALTIDKHVDAAFPRPGQRITYTIGVINGTPFSLTNGLISDTLPAGLTLAGPVALDPPSAGTVGAPPTLVSGLTITNDG